jgi:formylglycine-generating enzyme required for sulfatase activity
MKKSLLLLAMLITNSCGGGGGSSSTPESQVENNSLDSVKTENKVEDNITVEITCLELGGIYYDGACITSTNSLPSDLKMVYIQGGTFTMGGDTVANDASQVNVTLSNFSISQKEITNAQYIEFLNAAMAKGDIVVEEQTTADPCGSYSEKMIIGASSKEVYLQLGESGGCTSDGHEEHIDNRSWISYNADAKNFELLDSTKANWPVNWVKWHGANAFAKFYGLSLPSEAQWEYAARGGQDLNYATDDGTLDSSKANYNGDVPGVHSESGHVVATGSYAPNPYGLYDMSGNVWEWCLDYYDASFYSEGANNPLNTTEPSDAKRVRRGGSWNYHSATLLTYARASDYENRGNNHFGFRVVNSAK